LFSFYSTRAEHIQIHYSQPLTYEKQEQYILLRATAYIPDFPKNLKIQLGEQAITYKATANDSIALMLPLIGEPDELIFRSGKKIISKQIYHPVIPAEWGYFKDGTIHIIVSSHQDIAWMNTPEYCKKERIHDIILPALEIIKENKDFKFEMEQTLNLMELLEEYPEKKQEVIDAYKSGQFEWGATFNQPYEGIESGEQLVRQLYLGRKWIKNNLAGMDARTAYNVDVPGRTPQFPQILKKSGVNSLFISRFKEGFFRWYSPDGSHVLTYSPGNYGWAVLFYKYFDQDAPTAMQKLHKNLENWQAYYRERNIPPHYAVVISQDASGPIFYQEVLKEWNHIRELSEVPLPKLQHSTAEEFLHLVDVPTARFDSISGERPNIWMYIHGPGHYEAIKAKKEASVNLVSAEIFSTLASLIGDSSFTYPGAALDAAWFKSIYPDHGWGGLNGGITDSTFRAQLEGGNQIAKDLLHKALLHISQRVLTDKDDAILVYNDLNWKRKNIASISVGKTKSGYSVVDAQGKEVPSQLSVKNDTTQLHFLASTVPSVGYKTYYLKKSKSKLNSEVKIGSNFLENQYYRLVLGDGGIKSLYDKTLEQEILNTSRYAGGDVLDLGYDGNGAGEFNEMTPTNMQYFDKLSKHSTQWALIENGMLFTTFEAAYLLNEVKVVQRLKVYHHQKKIDFEYDIPEWKGRKNRQLRFALPLNTMKAKIHYDVPMGLATVGEDELDMSPGGWSWEGTYRQLPKFIHPREINNFISASTTDWGTTLSSTVSVADWIDPVRDAVQYPVLQGIMLSTHKSCHGMGEHYTQEGAHKFRFSLTSHHSGVEPAYVSGNEMQHHFHTVYLSKKNKQASLPTTMSFINSSSPFTRLSTFKQSDDGEGVILRLTEMLDRDTEVKIEFSHHFGKLFKTNMIEEEAQTIPQSGNHFSLSLGKSAIETYKLIPE